ncbi:putative repeat protein (TIGR01451 family)/gliding motility-associated-like protein [Winogradskyella pacifica]|uniref:Putative repeat protein (TIGR01451 family)/gliding motility-associated-like protein n=2 Tax=Winogradskyella pacifica TaxID=664642 RepID=A0A3D9MWL8_9FLAO|nr:putative repeat protein (TIGR01451 family)/gliding motility-associated-like protein [Winogradskyella pacifica]
MPTKSTLFLMGLALMLFSFANPEDLDAYENISEFVAPVTNPCNTDFPTPITVLNYDDLSVTSNTEGICILGCGIVDESYLIDSNSNNYTSLSTAIGLSVTHTLRVTDATTDEFYTAGGFAGFLIENTSVLQVNLLDKTVITTYLDGVEQESKESSSLAVVNSDLLSSNQFYVGFETTLDFDAVEISISSVVGVFSTTKIYAAVTENFCAGPELLCNTPTMFAKPEFPARIVEEHTGMGGVLSVGNVIDAEAAVDFNTNNYASINIVLGVLATGSLAIKDEFINYPANTYAGFDIENSSVLNLDLFDSVTITTYLDGLLQESQTGSSELIAIDSALLLTGTERSRVGFVSTLPFNEVQISINQTVSVDLGSTRVYGLVLESFCEGELDCNTATVLSNPSQPVIINTSNTGVDGLACVGCEVDNAINVISESNSDFAMINVVAGVANSASISVENVLSTFPSGSTAGFIIRDTNDLLEVDLLNSLTLTTYLDGIVQESETSSSLLALEALGLINITPSYTDGFYLVGFETSLPYDELRITVGALVAVINSIEVYGSYVDTSIKIEGTIINETVLGVSDGSIFVSVSGGTPPYLYLWSPNGEISNSISGLSPGTYAVTVTDALDCVDTVEFIVYTDGVQYPVPCNTLDPVAITSMGFTDLSVFKNTTGACVIGCGVHNEGNLLDEDNNNYATIATVVGLGVTHSLTVTDETVDEFFTGGGYAGMLIENNSILQADLLEAIVITTYLDGVEQESETNTALAVVNSALLGTDKYYVGFYTTMDYDAVEISISSLLNVLSTTNVYHAVTNSFCEGPDLICNTPTALTKPDFPVRIVDERTGTGGILSVGSINNTNRLFDSNTGNYATIDLLASVAGTASLAVKDEITDYPAMTYAGFDIENATLLNTQLFDAITVSTYLDGTFVESRTGSTELVPVNSGLLLTSNEALRVGFVSTAPFDEVQITLSQLVSLNLGSTRVYSMVLESFCPGTINCDEPYVLSNPNDSVIINSYRTGTEGIACVACEIDNSQHVISQDGSDFALINVVAGVASTASISVQDVLLDYPMGTRAGFIIRDTNDLLEVDLLNSITLTTYLDGLQQEQRTAGNLLALEALGLINITPLTTDGLYIVAFNAALSFDEIQITIASLVGVLNSIEVYGGYIDATNSILCDTAKIAIVKTGVFNDENSDNCSDSDETITYNFSVTNEGVVDLASVELTDLMLGGVLTLVSGDDDADNELDVDETWLYTANYTLTPSDIDAGVVSNQATVEAINVIDGTTETDLSDNDSVFEDHPTETILCQSADIAVIKTAVFNDENNDSCSDSGETITYTFNVTNEGNTSITTVVLTDAMLGGIIALASGDDDADNELDSDETWIYTEDYTLVQSDIDSGILNNQATVTGIDSIDGSEVTDLSDDNSVLEDHPTETILCQSADIAVIKTAVFNDENNDNCTDSGETITYTFNVTNEGNTSITAVELTDTMLGGIIALASGDDDADDELDVDEIWVYTANYTVVQSDIEAGIVSNQATVTGIDSIDGSIVTDLSDDNSVLEDEATETDLCQTAVIAVIKTGIYNDDNADGCGNEGETITYTFSVTNEGNTSITTVELTDTMLGGTIALASGDDDTDNELDVDETWIYTADYTLLQTDIDAGVVNNQATVTGVDSIDGSTVTDLSDDNSVLEDDATETDLCQSAEIAVVKTGVFNDENNDSCSDAGETITYTFNVTNEGNSSIISVELTDTMLGGIIALASGDTDADNELDANETWIYTAAYTLTQPDIDAGVVNNQATVTGINIIDSSVLTDLSDDNSVLEDEVTETILCQTTEIALIKMGDVNDANNDGCGNVDETITYTFTVTNEGNTTITSVELSDTMLGGIIALASGDTDADNELDVDETWIYTADYTLTQSDIDAGVVTNQAAVIGLDSIDGSIVTDLSDDDSISEDDVTETSICQTAEIAVIKTAEINDEDNDGCGNVDETITYTFTVTNEGNTSITTVELNDMMLGGIIALASGDTDVDNELDVDETWIYTADYTLTQSDIDAGVVNNQATVTGLDSIDGSVVTDLSDDDSVSEDDVTETALCQTATIAVVKTGIYNDVNTDGCADAGETITYNFTVTNEGNSSITSVELTDTMLGGIMDMSSGDDDTDNELDVGETWFYTADYILTQADIDAGVVNNQAIVTGISIINGAVLTDLSDDNSALENDITEMFLCQRASIAVVKTGVFNDDNSDGCGNLGETITYTFEVTNEGNISVPVVELWDSMLGGVMVLASGDDDADAELDVDETWWYTADYMLTQSDIDAGVVNNQATLTGMNIMDGTMLTDLSDDDNEMEDDVTTTVICQSGSISLEKAGVFNDENRDGVAEIGETLTYTFAVYNTGSITLYNISIEDPLPGIVIEGGPIVSLAPGEIDDFTFTAIYTLTQEDIDNGEITNQAVATSTGSDGATYTDTSDDPNNFDDVDNNDDDEPDDPTITDLPEILSSDFEIFNAITPDGDGENDFFKIVGIEDFPKNNLKIFNRWGILIYEMDGYGINGKVFRGFSDGRSTINRDEELPTGTYFYILRRFVGNQTLTNEGYLYIKNN